MTKEVYRISPIGYNHDTPSVLLKKDNEGNCHILFFRIWVEISNEQYETILQTALNKEEHFEITQIK